MKIPETHFFIDPSAVSGLQAQLREQIVAAILARRFPPGARLPASRRLADHLAVARVTVNLAYQALEADGYLASRPRSGIYVSDDPPGLIDGARDPRRTPKRGVEPVDWAARLGPTPRPLLVEKPADWRSYPYPFVFGQIDDRLFPHDAWRDCARRALGKREFNDVAADMRAQDDPSLVAYTLSHGLPSRGLAVAHDEVLITMGAQNALWLAVQVLARAKAAQGLALRAAVEDPCYPEMRAILADVGAEIVTAPIDANGLDPALLPSGLDLVCVSPNHQAPTGATLPKARRQALLARAAADDFVVLEDDYDVEMQLTHPPSPALKALDLEDRVLYVGSYSKPLFPGLRLGCLAAPAAFIDATKAIRSVAMRHPPGVTQRAAAHFLALGHYNAHLQRLRRIYAERRAIAAAALREAGFQLASKETAGGSSLWVRAPNDLDSAALAAKARGVGVLIEAGAPFFAEAGPTPFFRMAISSIPTEKIAEGVRRLAASV